MSQPGIGAMLHYLSGGSGKDPAKYYGKTIKAAEIKDDKFRIEFTDSVAIELWDDGQSCCEHRYMSTDDDVSSLIGKRLVKIEAKEHKEESADYEEHEMVFVEVAVEDGWITIVNHNEHNGYYGGFGLTISECKAGLRE